MKRLLPRLLAVLAGVVVGLLLAEGLVRLFMPDPGAVKAVRDLRPAERTRGGGAAARPKGERARIAFLGDSYVYGQGVEFPDIFPVRTGAILRRERPGREIEILVYGRPGADTRDELETLRSEILPGEPDLVVLGFVLNDFTHRAIRQQFTAAYKREKNRTLVFRGLERFSRLAYFLDWTLFQLLSDMDRIHSDYLDGLFDPRRNAEYPGMKAALDELLRLMAPRRGIVLFMPMFAEGERERPFYRSALALLQASCAEHGVDLIEMLPHFQGRAASSWWASLEDHHPNAEAHAVIARVLGARILERGLL